VISNKAVYSIVLGTDPLHLLENTFDRKRISANLIPNPNSSLKPNLKSNPNPKAQ